MKVLVTGTAGFIGSHLALKLLERGDEIVGLDNLSDYYDVNLKKARLARFIDHPKYTHITADLADRVAVEAAFATHKPQRVVNLAAQAGVRYAAENPHVYVSSNVTGFLHILDGTDHLLFLACLVIPFRRFRALVLIVTAFTIAHSITLIASAFDLAPGGLWFPPLVETLIAISILYMALENIVGARVQQRWMIAFAFGLVHGFGFSTALRDQLQFAGSHLLTSLAAFNVGVELAQLAVLAVAVPALRWMFARGVPERMGVIIASAFITHEAWH